MIKALKVFSVVLTESPAISPSASELGAKSADRTGAQSFLIRKCRFWLNFWYRLVLVLQRRSNHQRARSAGKTLLHSPSMPLSEVNARAAPPSQREKAEWNSTVPAELTPPTFSCRPNIYIYVYKSSSGAPFCISFLQSTSDPSLDWSVRSVRSKRPPTPHIFRVVITGLWAFTSDCSVFAEPDLRGVADFSVTFVLRHVVFKNSEVVGGKGGGPEHCCTFQWVRRGFGLTDPSSADRLFSNWGRGGRSESLICVRQKNGK